jgi:hypothetical protein
MKQTGVQIAASAIAAGELDVSAISRAAKQTGENFDKIRKALKVKERKGK